MQWAIGESHKSIGAKGELLEIKEVQGIGQTAIIGGATKRIGAGGLGMGVNLAASDQYDQERSKKMLEKILKESRRRKRREQREQEAQKRSASAAE